MDDTKPATPNEGVALAAELDALQRRVDALRSELDRIGPDRPRREPYPDDRSTSRRHLLHLAGASAVGVLGGAVAGGRPAAAADPNDVVKDQSNTVTAPTTLDGAFPGPVLSLFNRSGADSARALYAYTDGESPAIRADNNSSVGAVGVAANAPAGIDLHAVGSGRIALDDHAFGAGNEYVPGEIHQSGGTVYAMVTESVRRVLAAPGGAGALFPIDPIRVYDSRVAAPFFGAILAGQSRTIEVDDARDRTTGAIVQAGAIPPDATAIAYNLTVARTVGRGFLSVTPEAEADPDTSTINWSADDVVAANSSIVGVGSGVTVSVFCGGDGATDFIVDVVGYYR